jgi:hypothetical protein
MVQSALGGFRDGRRDILMLIQDRHALSDARVTDIAGCAADKTLDIVGATAAERAPQRKGPPDQFG